jgi:hypothetical protein
LTNIMLYWARALSVPLSGPITRAYSDPGQSPRVASRCRPAMWSFQRKSCAHPAQLQSAWTRTCGAGLWLRRGGTLLPWSSRTFSQTKSVDSSGRCEKEPSDGGSALSIESAHYSPPSFGIYPPPKV